MEDDFWFGDLGSWVNGGDKLKMRSHEPSKIKIVKSH